MRLVVLKSLTWYYIFNFTVNINNWPLFYVWNFCCLDIAKEDDKVVDDENDEDYCAPVDGVSNNYASDDEIKLQTTFGRNQRGYSD